MVAGNLVAWVDYRNETDPVNGVNSDIYGYDSRMAGVPVLVLPPFADTEAELAAYFETVLAGTESDLGLYECPVPARRSLPTRLVGQLARTGRFVCYKETSCDPAVIAAQLAATSGTPLAVLQANTPYLLAARQLGCPGSMCISANVAPDVSTLIGVAVDLGAGQL